MGRDRAGKVTLTSIIGRSETASDGEPANEFDFFCPGHIDLWLVAIHDGLAYQVAWLDDGPFTASDLRPKLDEFLQSFTFAP